MAEWTNVLIKDVIVDMSSGDWGVGEAATGHEACYVLRGTDFQKAQTGVLEGVPVRFFKPNSVQKRRLSAGHLLVELSGGSKDQPTGRLLYVTEEFLGRAGRPVVFSNFVKRLRLKLSLVDPEFFGQYWEYLYQSGRTRTYEKRTTGIRNFKLADFARNEEIVVPCLAEQRAIAASLRVVQRAKEGTEKVIAATRQLKASLMKYLFTYGPVPFDQADKVPLKETEIGPVPAHWKVAPLGEFITFQRGFDLPSHRRVEGVIPVVSSSGVTGFHAEAKVKGPGVVIGRYGSIGTVHYVKEDFWPLNTTLFVKCFGDCNAKFVSYFLQTLNFHVFNDKTSIPGVNRNDLHALKVPMPAPEEQPCIADILSQLDLKIAVEERRRTAMESLFKSFLHHLMTGKVRVPNAEAAGATGD